MEESLLDLIFLKLGTDHLLFFLEGGGGGGGGGGEGAVFFQQKKKTRPKPAMTTDFVIWAYKYGKCSKISKTSCLPKRPKQIAQTQIRLRKQSDQGLPCLLF